MKTSNTTRIRRSTVKPKEQKERQRSKPTSEEAIRMCEEAAAQMKSAGEELVACWNLLSREHLTCSSTTDLLRRRAWCNVLELRLKEHAHRLEEARLALDTLWPEVMQTVRARELFKRFHNKCSEESLFHKSWSLLLQPKAPVSRPRSSIQH
jgi:hypothetical protein